MSTIVLTPAGKGFAKLLALKSTPSPSRHRSLRPLNGRYVCPLSMLGDSYLPPLVTIFCS